MGHRGRVRQTLFLALVVDLALGPGPAWNCLQCDPGFAVEFASYIPRLSRKSWGLGDVPAAGRRLRGWAQDTLREIHLDVPLEIRESPCRTYVHPAFLGDLESWAKLVKFIPTHWLWLVAF